MSSYEQFMKGYRSVMSQRSRILYDRYGDLRFTWVLIFGATVLSVVGGTIFFFAVNYSRGIAERACHTWGRKTERQVRFATYNWGSWSCLVRSSDGKYVPQSQIITFTNKTLP